MVILTTLVLLAFSIGGLFVLQYAFHLYNQEIYRQSAQALQVSSNSVEAELKKMERLSYQVATDRYVQSFLLNLHETDSSYQQYIIGTDLRKRLLQIGALNKYILSFQVYDTNDSEYASGNVPINIHSKRLQKIKREAIEMSGGASWVSPGKNDPSIIVARTIREYMNFSLERLGMVGIRVNIEEIVNDLTNNLDDQQTKFLIYDDKGEKIFSSENKASFLNIIGKIPKEQGYQMVKHNGERYFLTYSKADHLNWTYMILTPYDNLFTVITQAKTAVFITYSILFLIMIFLGFRFTGMIVNPIESLNQKMKKVQSGDWQEKNMDDNSTFTKDEAGQMHANFQKMMSQIHHLIDENYKKQLLIRESEYKTLQAQLNPHFLYNTLESINWSAKVAGEKKISQMAESLGFVLRSSINMKDMLISLQKEVAIVDHYITIQQYRFEDRLIFQKDIAPELLERKVPKFIIQPIVENSIRYALQEMVDSCTILLVAKEKNNCLMLYIRDNGPGMDTDFLEKVDKGTTQPKGNGIGLKNINDRIKLLFGDQYGLDIKSSIKTGTTISITLPGEELKPYV